MDPNPAEVCLFKLGFINYKGDFFPPYNPVCTLVKHQVVTLTLLSYIFPEKSKLLWSSCMYVSRDIKEAKCDMGEELFLAGEQCTVPFSTSTFPHGTQAAKQKNAQIV